MATLRSDGTRVPSGSQLPAVRALLERPLFELIPLRNAMARAEALPRGAGTTVTASPSHGIESTLELCGSLTARGHPSTPHLAARMVRDRSHLADVLERCRAAGIRDAFVIGGDGRRRGEFHDAISLLRTMGELGHPFTRIGVAAYPEGHPSIGEERSLASLKEKQHVASYMTTQMSFDANAIARWVGRMRSSGVVLPIHIGLPGTVEIRRLLRLAARIGVSGAIRYLRKNRQLLGVVVGRSFTPERLLLALAPMVGDPRADVQALHLFTFNEVEPTVGWQRRMLEELSA